MTMLSSRILLLLGILGACTCGGDTSECKQNAQLSLLTSIHEDSSCEVVSNRGVMTYEAAHLIIEDFNKQTNSLKIDLSVLDTCDNIDGTIKGTMRALMKADLDCLHAPYYLGIVGPQSAVNVDAVQKIVSTLNIPHVVQTGTTSVPYLHKLEKESISYLVEGILEVIEALRWKSFTLVVPKQGCNEDVQLVAKKLTTAAITRGLCITIHDQEGDVFTSQIVHIGKPPEGFFDRVNGTVLIVSQGNLEHYVTQIKTPNSILLLEDSRSSFAGLEERVAKSKWWADGQGADKYNAEELSNIRWLQRALGIFTKSLEVLCAQQNCSSEINSAEWNSIVSNVIAKQNPNPTSTAHSLRLYVKLTDEDMERVGQIKIENSVAMLHWTNTDEDTATSEQILPEAFRDLLPVKETSSDCVSNVKTSAENDVTRVLFAGVDDDWWRMVAIVGGIGIVMFCVGIFAVYVVIVNIRGPKSPNKGRRIKRDFSLRRVTSIPDTQVVETPQRPPRDRQRRDSNRSNISD